MGKVPEGCFPKRRMDGQQIYEKVFNQPIRDIKSKPQ